MTNLRPDSLRPSQIYEHLTTKRLRPGYYLVGRPEAGDQWVVHRNGSGWEAIELDPEGGAMVVRARTKHEIMQTLEMSNTHAA